MPGKWLDNLEGHSSVVRLEAAWKGHAVRLGFYTAPLLKIPSIRLQCLRYGIEKSVLIVDLAFFAVISRPVQTMYFTTQTMFVQCKLIPKNGKCLRWKRSFWNFLVSGDHFSFKSHNFLNCLLVLHFPFFGSDDQEADQEPKEAQWAVRAEEAAARRESTRLYFAPCQRYFAVIGCKPVSGICFHVGRIWS